MKARAGFALASVAGFTAWALLRRAPAEYEPDPATGEPVAVEEPQQGSTGPQLVAPLLAWTSEAIQRGPEVDTDTAARNAAAFLAMLRKAEGTADANGYRAIFGHTPRRPVLFDSWADHPRRAVQFRDGAGRVLWTSAAGAYQFMAISPLPSGGSTKVNTWDRLRDRLNLPDFSPASQDAAALELIREAGALGDVRAGRFDQAVSKVRRIWASLPGAGYAQPEKSRDSLLTAYLQAGGTTA